MCKLLKITKSCSDWLDNHLIIKREKKPTKNSLFLVPTVKFLFCESFGWKIRWNWLKRKTLEIFLKTTKWFLIVLLLHCWVYIIRRLVKYVENIETKKGTIFWFSWYQNQIQHTTTIRGIWEKVHNTYSIIDSNRRNVEMSSWKRNF